MFYQFPEMILIVFITTKKKKSKQFREGVLFYYIFYTDYIKNFIDLANSEMTKNNPKFLKVRCL